MKSNLKIKNLPYRKNVSCILYKNNKYLLVQLADWKKNWWKFPQGGIEKNETIKETIKRELFEELGISKIKIIAKSSQTNLYDWPKEIIVKNDLGWRGQNQIFYLIEYLGAEADVKILDPDEIKKFRWVTKTELLRLIRIRDKRFTNYRDIIQKIFQEFNNILH